MDNLAPLILLALICIAVGFAVGSAFTGMRGDKGRPVAGKDLPLAGMVEVVHLWRDRRNGHLVPEIEGKTFQMSGGLSSMQRALLVQALEDLRLWLGVPAVTPSSDGAQPEIGKSDLSRGPATLSTGSPSVKPSGLSPVNVLARAIGSELPKPTVTKSIAAQIDEILQEDLENSHLQNRAIRLLELPGKGMVVMVGLEQFDGVSSVPDPEIRDLIHRAVERWEQRTSGD